MSTSGNRTRGERSAGIFFLSIGVGALFAFGTRLEASKEVGERKGAQWRWERGGCSVSDEDTP